jgi:predicted dehydrogenase
MAERDDYALVSAVVPEIPAPDLAYRPPQPTRRHPIALVGAGGISFAHLDAYRTQGWDVVAILSRDEAKARARRDEFFPAAEVMTDYAALLARDDIAIVDLTPHPAERLPLMDQALRAGKHVLSQKPFVSDLDDGERLCTLADAQGVRLAVNQNGRWSPHMAWMRAAVRAGLLGDVMGVHCTLNWDHRWIRGTPFETMEDVVLFDFGVHWFDFVTSILDRPALRVQAQSVPAPSAGMATPMLGAALMDWGDAQATLSFDAATPFGPGDRTVITGSAGTLTSTGPDLGQQEVTLTTKDGVARPQLQGKWFNDGFAGAMGALMVAIESGQEPENSARGNLVSLAHAFAALQAARTGQPVTPGTARRRAS